MQIVMQLGKQKSIIFMTNLSALGVHSLLEVQHVTFIYKVCERTSQDFHWQCKSRAVTDGLHTNGILFY